MAPSGHAGLLRTGATNPYTRAYQREVGSRGNMRRDLDKASNKVLLSPVIRTRRISGNQANCLCRARLHALVDALACSNALGTGLALFVARNTPTVGDLIQFTQHHSIRYNGQTKKKGRNLSTVALAQTNIKVCTTVQREYTAIKGSGTYQRILKEKPDNVI
jgi:hypothetical protein